MAEKKTSKEKIEVQTPSKQPPTANIFARANRGLLLDMVVFLANLFLMRLLAEQFVALIKDASDGDEIAGFAVFLFCLGLFVLPAAGAVLKRWHFQRRMQMKGETIKDGNFVFGCLFNPIFYFCLNLVIYSAINAFLMQFIYGRREPGEAVFVSSIFFGLFLTIVQTVLIYRYFSPPKREPSSAYLKSPQSENLGDVCIFLYTLCFQLLWNLLTLAPLGKVADFTEFAGRLFVLCFLALVVYFPPRIFYLAEDIHRRRTWLTILLANSPLILRFLFGTDSNANW
ncbi:MAG: hypothetical protein ACR2HG_03400 [Pyrinomonadaceae bacterium]